MLYKRNNLSSVSDFNGGAHPGKAVQNGGMHDIPQDTDPQAFWDERYSSATSVWSGNVNPTLSDAIGGFTPGTSLDLGCGEGGDVVWLAQNGWDALGVDLSAVAVERARKRADEAGVTKAAHFIAADLSTWRPPSGETFTLITASFFQSPVRLERGAILREIAGHVAPGGHLVVVSHAAPPPWHAGGSGGPKHFFSPEDELDLLDLDPARWEVLRAEVVRREATGPQGQRGTLEDTVVVARALRAA